MPAGFSAEDARLLEVRLVRDIRSILGNDSKVGTFLNPNGLEPVAWATPHADSAIVIDKVLSRFLIRLSTLVVAATFAPFEDDCAQEAEGLAEFFLQGGTPPDTQSWLAIVRRCPSLFGHSVALFRAWFAFVFCHEVAHHRLGHLAEQTSHETELKADRFACTLFRRLITTEKETEELRLTHNLMLAPAILFASFDFLRRGVDFPELAGTYPTFNQRFETIVSALGPTAEAQAVVFLESVVRMLASIAPET